MSEVKVREVAAAMFEQPAGGEHKYETAESKPYWNELARAAIRAMRSPTEEMIRVGDVLHGLNRADVLEIWEVMCDEALR